MPFFSRLSALWQSKSTTGHASRLDIHDAESLNLLAALNIEQNRLDLACSAQYRAVKRQPDQPQQYAMLADVLERSGRHAEAQNALSEMQSLRALATAATN